MSTEKTSLPKSIAKVAGKIIFQIGMFFLIGVIVNWIYGFRILFDLGDGAAGIKLLLVAVFFVGFPFIYVWQAKGYAISVGLNQLYSNSQGFFKGIVNKVTSGVVNGMDKTGGSSGITSTLFNGAIGVAKTSEKLPAPIKWVLNFFLNQIPLRESLGEVGKEVDLTPANINAINDKVFDKVDDYMKNELLNTGLSWFWILLIINILAIAASHYFFIAG